MKLGNKLTQLIAQLPAKQQTLDFASDRLWHGLTSKDQIACRKTIARLLLRVVINDSESNEEAINNYEENNEHD